MTSIVYVPTLNDMVARVRTFVDEASQANYTNTEIIYAINAAQQFLATEITQVDELYFVNPVPTTITPAGTPIAERYQLASDFFKMIRMEVAINQQMVPFINFNEKVNNYSGIPPIVNSLGSGDGTRAYIIGSDYVGFTPPPTDPTVQFQYWYAPIVPDLVAGTDTSILPRPFVDFLPQMAAVDMFIKDEDQATTLEGKIGQQLEQIKRAARDRQQQNPKYVRRSQTAASSFPWLGL